MIIKNKKRSWLVAAIGIPAIICGIWYWQSLTHQDKHEKVSGETSFDIYADAGKIHMLLLRQHGEHQTIVYRQIRDGKSGDNVALPVGASEKIISRRSNDVQIAAAGNHLLAAWQVSGTGYANRGPMRIAQSRDAGKTWQQLPPPTAPNRTDDQGFLDIVTDARSRFHLVWLDSQAKTKGLRYAMFADGKWSTPQTIDAETCQCCWNSLAKNVQGELLVLYRNAKPRDMALAKFDGSIWKKSGLVDNFGWKIEICPHAGGGLAADADFTYAVTWSGLESALGCHFIKMENSKQKWQPPAKFGAASARNPDVAENSSAVAVVWDEFEGQNRRTKFMTAPKSAAEKWSVAQTLSDPTAAGSYPRIVADKTGFYAFWTETKNGAAIIRGRKL